MEFVKKIPMSPIRAISEIVPMISQTRPYGKDRPVLNGTVGEPTHPVEDSVVDAMHEIVESYRGKPCGYTSFFGAPEFRERLAAVINKEYTSLNGEEPGFKTENTLMSVGASSGLQAAIFALSNEDVPILTPAPYYLLYKSQAGLARANLVEMDTESTGYKITPTMLEQHLQAVCEQQKATPDTVRANVLFDYPGNPIGAMLNAEEWQGIAQVLRKYPKVNIMLDEIYRDIIVNQDSEGKPKPYVSLLHVAPDLKDRTLLFFAGSKGCSLAGERIGGVVGPVEAINALATIQFPILVHPSRTSQAAFVKGMEMISQSPDIRKKVSDFYKVRLDAVRQGLGDAVIKADVEGAFYVVADLKDLIGKPFSEKARNYIRSHPANFEGLDTDTIQNDKQIALQLLFENGVAVTPGSAFGFKPEDGKMRIACTASPQQLRDMTAEIRSALGQEIALPAPPAADMFPQMVGAKPVMGKASANIGARPTSFLDMLKSAFGIAPAR